MISCPAVQKAQIRTHYDLGTLFYRLLWGRHIHHGLWDADESPQVAQLRLIDALAAQAGIVAARGSNPGQRVLDVGCGMGGSSIHLAREFHCQVSGITLSGVQRRWAAWSAWRRGVGRNASFLRADAEQVEFAPQMFDVVWSVEATEHLFDKPRFFRRAFDWLAPGGRVAICAWLAGDDLRDEQAKQQVFDVCEGFYCPSLGSSADYQQWMRAAGFRDVQYQDWTDRVVRTWEICARRTRWTGTNWLAPWLDHTAGKFLQRFETILAAYRSGAMRYGCFVARKEGVESER